MDLTFARWDLVGNDQLPRTVLRVLVDGLAVSDDGVLDCFVSPIVAAEAAWRVLGDRSGPGSWLDAAYVAADGASSGPLRRDARPPVRIVTSEMIERGAIRWVGRRLALAPTGDWALADQAGLPEAVLSDSAPDLQPVDDEHQLSGDHTAEWVLVRHAVEAAGPPKAGQRAAVLSAQAQPDSEQPLSGASTQEWTFAGNAGHEPLDD